MATITEFGQLALVLGAAGVLGGGVYSSAIERFWIEVREVGVSLARLPRSFSGFRIALLSDIHLGFFYTPKNLLSAANIINGLHPDIICLAGDFIDSKSSLGVLEPVIPVLSGLKAAYGKFAVLGNHDHRAGSGRVIRCLERGGFRVLVNNHAVLKKENGRIFLAGLDDILKGRPSLETAMKGIPDAACTILLVHEPDCAGYTGKFPVDLQLSGHSHGGQVRFPFLGPLITTRLGKKYHSGLYRINKLMLYTNRGLGTTILPVRFLCRPELTLITLE